MTEKSPCFSCVHRIDIPGNCHVGCQNMQARPQTARWPGCGAWPINYDPNIIGHCPGFSSDPKDKLTAKPNPLVELLRLIG